MLRSEVKSQRREVSYEQKPWNWPGLCILPKGPSAGACWLKGLKPHLSSQIINVLLTVLPCYPNTTFPINWYKKKYKVSIITQLIDLCLVCKMSEYIENAQIKLFIYTDIDYFVQPIVQKLNIFSYLSQNVRKTSKYSCLRSWNQSMF